MAPSKDRNGAGVDEHVGDTGGIGSERGNSSASSNWIPIPKSSPGLQCENQSCSACCPTSGDSFLTVVYFPIVRSRKVNSLMVVSENQVQFFSVFFFLQIVFLLVAFICLSGSLSSL